MHMLKLSETHGLNLDQVLEWFDSPDLSVPSVEVVFTAASEHETGQRTPYARRLQGAERDLFLHHIDYVSRQSYHASHA